MSPGAMRSTLRLEAVVLAMLSVVPTEALARNIGAATPPPYRMERPGPSYAGDCGPNPPPGYRSDLHGWRSGFNRDFDCYMLDEY